MHGKTNSVTHKAYVPSYSMKAFFFIEFQCRVSKTGIISRYTFQLCCCIFSVITFWNADVTHNEGNIEVECHELCSFPDGSSVKTWTCDGQLPEEGEGCKCQGKLK